MNYVQAVEYLMNIPKFTHEPGLEPAKRLLKLLGNPEENKKIIHVAGTNGKGSVCAYMNSVLTKAGINTGLFTSPHLVRIEERIRINGRMVSEELFAEAFEVVLKCAGELEAEFGRLSFFEFLFGMAMYCFDKAGVEYIVLETGLGGRLDATNAIEQPAVTVITPVSFDHVGVLGDTIEAIAGEKAGIIKKNVPIVFWAENETVREVVFARAEKLGAPCRPIVKSNYEILKNSNKSVDFCVHNRYYKNSGYSVPFPAVYQAGNAMLAIEALDVLALTDERITYERVADGIKNTSWAGRFEEIAPGVIVDGAHNEDGIRSFIEAVNGIPRVGRIIILFTVMKDKDYRTMVEMLCEQVDFDVIIVTESDGGSGRAVDAFSLKEEFNDHTDKKVIAIEDLEAALRAGLELIGENDTLYCVGSLYLVGAVLKEYGR
ncbi:MAG: bifunctional folylpolyglutamate synthase/dihydrofolate synthase [Lachnospiraceae bacterium]|nr:bifunctional folylpolyglutamate synthase/dihydrofolate synthase [Lachnospiraceae bacterium]